MDGFDGFKLKKQLRKAVEQLQFDQPTPIQLAAFGPIKGGSDFVGIAQTGTGKTFAYLLPILEDLTYTKDLSPRVLILVPTRELVIQIVEEVEKLTPFMNVKTLGVYGGTNIVSQKQAIIEGVDILVATPRRLYDLALTNVLRLNAIKKLVIDEVDIMLDFGFKTQLNNIFDYLPKKRQNLLFSATMTTYVDELINEFLVKPVKKTISISGTPLDTIAQSTYDVPNFYTKANLLKYLLNDRERFHKVLVFVRSKVNADRLYEMLEMENETSVIHSSKEQNHRSRSIEQFRSGESRVLIATDVIARGVDIEDVSTVISFDTPFYPENYIHRIGRTGRAGATGTAILFCTEKEQALKVAIEDLMQMQIPVVPFPQEVTVNTELTPEEKDKPVELMEPETKKSGYQPGPSFHEKSAKNSREKTVKKSYEQKLKEKFKKPIRRGDKIQNLRSKKKRK